MGKQKNQGTHNPFNAGDEQKPSEELEQQSAVEQTETEQSAVEQTVTEQSAEQTEQQEQPQPQAQGQKPQQPQPNKGQQPKAQQNQQPQQQKPGVLRTSSSFASHFTVKEVSKELQGFVHLIDEYIDSMKPTKRISERQLLSNQMKLRSIINTLFDQSEKHFDEAMKILLSAMREHRNGVFSEYSIMRGFPNLRVNKSERQRLENIINLLMVSVDSQNPRAVSHSIDFNVLFRYVRDNREQSLIQSFFSG